MAASFVISFGSATSSMSCYGCSIIRRFVDTPVEIRDKYQYFTEARMEKLRAAGYTRPFTSIEDGIAKYFRDHLATPDPYV